jgi:hypothetical protein
LEGAEAGAAEAPLCHALLDLAHVVISLCAYGAGLSGVSEANGTGNHILMRWRATTAHVASDTLTVPRDLRATAAAMPRR